MNKHNIYGAKYNAKLYSFYDLFRVLPKKSPKFFSIAIEEELPHFENFSRPGKWHYQSL